MRTTCWLLLFYSSLTFAKTEMAIFAGGCFWCMEADFDKVPGVLSTISGFDGGTFPNPSYQLVSSGHTNYTESVKVTFDPDKVSYQALVEYFWRHIDPTAKDAQFCDHGRQYRSAIFYLNTQQKKIAKASKNKIEKLFPTVYTEISPSTHFYPAEKYHQNYYRKNPIRYRYYRYQCGRDQRIQEVWLHESAKTTYDLKKLISWIEI